MEDDVLQRMCALFALGAPRGAAGAVAGGLTNRLWRVETVDGVFAVKQMNRDPKRADYVAWFDRAFSLEQAAYTAGVPMPRPVPVAATGSCLGELTGADGRLITVRVHAWVEGEKLDNSVMYEGDVAGRVGAILARIHALDMPSDVAASEALRVFGDEHWQALAARLERAGGWSGAVFGLLPALRELEAYLAAAHADTASLLLSHRDSDKKNFMRTPAGDLVLVDWDAAGPVHWRHDLANEALTWAGVHMGDPAPAIARAFIDAYRRAGGSDERFRATDLAELVAVRLGWFDFNIRRALGEQVRDEADREYGAGVVRRNVEQLPRFARSLAAWVAALGD
jgi:hypothetical protein